jgi:ribosomal protein L17
MASSLFKHELIRTTLPKAKELRRVAEPLIKLGQDRRRRQSPASHLRVCATKKPSGKLFVELGPRYRERKGRLHAHPEVRFPRRRQRADATSSSSTPAQGCGRTAA